jgi:hypothetical protein|tara:strand:+ start:973 stop:1260 length:288 start_codon:yes stop_codon:yes gene_type:complete
MNQTIEGSMSMTMSEQMAEPASEEITHGSNKNLKLPQEYTTISYKANQTQQIQYIEESSYQDPKKFRISVASRGQMHDSVDQYSSNGSKVLKRSF